MPNRYQLVFLATFFSVLATLIVVSNIVKAKLKEAGYDISELILIGLPKDKQTSAVDTKSPLTPFVSESIAKMIPQVFALLLAVVTSAVVYWKFGSSKSCDCFCH
jgi:cytochrome-b5 reductase